MLNQILSLCDYISKIKDTDEYKMYLAELENLENDLEYQKLVLKIDSNAADYHQMKRKIQDKERRLRALEKQVNTTIYKIEKAIKEKL